MTDPTEGPVHWVNPDDDSPWTAEQSISPADLRTIKEYGENKTEVIGGKSYTSFALPKWVLRCEESPENPADAVLICAAFNAAQAAKELGYDPIAAVEALPKVLTALTRALLFIKERGYNVEYGAALDAARTRKE